MGGPRPGSATVRPRVARRGPERSEHYADNARAIAKAQADGLLRTDVAPAHLLYAARAPAAWWLANTLGRDTHTGAANESPQERRRVLVKLVNDATRKP
ncbi:hypothetical protein ACWELB_09050 [Streptomyces asiaticus]